MLSTINLRKVLFLFFSFLFSFAVSLLILTNAEAKNGKNKILICHMGSEIVLDADGNPVLDDDGEPVEEVYYQPKLLPEPAIKGHLRHGDHLIVADDDGNVTPCESLNDDVISEAEVQLFLSGAAPDDDYPGKRGYTAIMRAEAGAKNDDLQTPADVIHPNIHQNNGPGNNANPNGANPGGGNMHGIANNPGQSGDKPGDDGVSGFANELNTVHGGIGTKNKNAGN